MKLPKSPMKYWRTVILLLVVLSGVGLITLWSAVTKADEFSWLSDEAVAVEDVAAGYSFDCARQSIRALEPDPSTQIREKAYQACITEGKNISMARYTDSTGSPRWAVKIGTDAKYRNIRTANFATNFQLVRDTNMVVFRPWDQPNFRGFATIENLIPALEPSETTTDGKIINYEVDMSGRKNWFEYTNDGHTAYNNPVNYALSPNGRYALAWLNYRLMVKIDLLEDTTTGIGYFQGSANNGLSNPEAAGISNDGRYAFVRNGPTVIDAQGCGFEITSDNLTDGSAFLATQPQCPRYNYGSALANLSGYSGYEQQYSWNSSEELFQLVYQPAPNDTTNNKLVTLGDPSTQTSKLDYLALGDSYSSGEGDTEKDALGNKYYRAFTDVELNLELGVPEEKCHLSTRSYPYLLAASMGLSLSGPKQWDSVACSGAETKDVSGKAGYKGQGGRLKDFNVDLLQDQALNEFIPGRVQQIEFVKKYKPKAITLTMGGNDVGFGKKIEDCAFTSTYVIDATCSIAKSENRKKLYDIILNQFDELSRLYSLLHSASPSTKVYALSYPQFISADSSSVCAPNVLALNDDERQMIEQSVGFFNQVIEQASKRAGVVYINIQNSFSGHKLCDLLAEKYVTGFSSVDWPESFHPNAKGHVAIMQTIQDKVGSDSLIAYDTCPQTPEQDVVCPDESITDADIDIPEYFQTESQEIQKVEYTEVTLSEVSKSSNMRIQTDSYSFAPASTVTLAVYSERTELGAFETSATGTIETEVAIPSMLPVGYHTLVLEGETYSGEPITYEQVILVKGADPSDIDDDGVIDSIDKCLFIEPANIDQDQDSTDDACDPNISSSPITTEPYRVRMGDSNRMYTGNPEDERYLYVERNVGASDQTSISGDYDPDGDGWAIVAASQGSIPKSSDPSVLVPDVGPNANFIIRSGTKLRPFAYVRTANNGCVGLTPKSLAVVKEGQVRKFKLAGLNNSKCRAANTSDDIDGNSLPDNTQPLYSARNGISLNGEDPAKIYLFRSHAAAEAQLGVSDYSPTGTAAAATLTLSNQPIQPWNLLASMQTRSGFSYNMLVILTDSEGKPRPIVLATKNNKCHAFEPQNTSLIKQSTQMTRGFEKLTVVPEGVGCE